MFTFVHNIAKNFFVSFLLTYCNKKWKNNYYLDKIIILRFNYLIFSQRLGKLKGITGMIKIKAGKRKAVASALTFCFFLQQSFCLQVFATNISGVTGVDGVFDIIPDASNGGIGFKKYPDFSLSHGDIANLIFYDYGKSQDISTFVNLVDNQINIQGLVNSVGKDGAFTNGNVVFVSPNGMVVGASGVLNVGSLLLIEQ